jgi:hypothetical protein
VFQTQVSCCSIQFFRLHHSLWGLMSPLIRNRYAQSQYLLLARLDDPVETSLEGTRFYQIPWQQEHLLFSDLNFKKPLIWKLPRITFFEDQKCKFMQRSVGPHLSCAITSWHARDRSHGK